MSYGPEEGNDHTCTDCGAKWWDADGGCSCTKCRHCGNVGDEDLASAGYCEDCKDAEIERLEKAAVTLEGDVFRLFCKNAGLSKILLNANHECIKLQNRIRALEFQNADLRLPTHYTPSEFLARFGSVDDGPSWAPGAPAVITDAPTVESLSVLREAMDIVGGARKAEYGDQRVNFQKYAEIATLMLDSADLEALASGSIPSAVVVKILMAVKLGRHAFKPKRDNLVDLAGYTDILHTVQGG